MLADDLFGLEALDPLGARVPAGHEALRVEHVDRVVEDRLDQAAGMGPSEIVLRANSTLPANAESSFTAPEMHQRHNAQHAIRELVALVTVDFGGALATRNGALR